MRNDEEGRQEFVRVLRSKAESFELEAHDTCDKTNKGYFTGKAEALYQVADAIANETGMLDDE